MGRLTAPRIQRLPNRTRKWIGVYRDRKKTEQGWLCKGCGAIDDDHNHAEGPANDLCKCVSHKVISTPSEAYRRGFEQIRWGNGPG